MNKYVINPKSFIYYNSTENEIRELMNILPIHNSIMNSVIYILYREDVDYCVLIDCGEWETLQPVLERISKSVKAVLLTMAIQIISNNARGTGEWHQHQLKLRV